MAAPFQINRLFLSGNGLLYKISWMKIKNFLISGLPQCGKTTLIKEVVSQLDIEKKGFFTEEIRENGERTGFKIVTLSGKQVILAHRNFASPYRVSRYAVSISNLENVAVKEIEQGLHGNFLIVIDEIGKMELFSEKFKETVIRAFDSKNRILGTILFKSNSFCDGIKKRNDTKLLLLTRENYCAVKQDLLQLLNQ